MTGHPHRHRRAPEMPVIAPEAWASFPARHLVGGLQRYFEERNSA
jgi:hypothetical protein